MICVIHIFVFVRFVMVIGRRYFRHSQQEINALCSIFGDRKYINV